MTNAGADADVWRCAKGCNQSWWLKEHQGPCPHLERLIGPKGGSTWRRLIVVDDRALERSIVSQAVTEADIPSDWQSEMHLRHKLAKVYGLSQKHVEIVIDRVIKGLTYKEIAKERGYVSKMTARLGYLRILKRLRKKGYN